MSFWTDNPGAEERLRERWKAGDSANQIAKLLGCNRNQVIGKSHRLGLQSRPSPIKRLPAPVVLTEKSCQWYEGEPSEPPCGAPVAEGKPYCSNHCARAYRNIERKKSAGVSHTASGRWT